MERLTQTTNYQMATDQMYIAQLDKIFKKFQLEETFYAKAWVDSLKDGLESGITIFGSGSFGANVYMRFMKQADIPVLHFCDNDSSKWGETIIDGLTCIAPDQLKYTGTRIVVAVSGYEQVIKEQCLKLGIRPEDIFIAPIYMFSWCCNYRCSTDSDLQDEFSTGTKAVLSLLDDEYSKELLLRIVTHYLIDGAKPFINDGTQYFIQELPIRPNEAFVDMGSYIGDTLAEFTQNIPSGMERSGLRYYAFECSQKNLEILQQNAAAFSSDFSIEMFNIACWDEKKTLVFTDNMRDGGAVNCVDIGIEIQADKLDSILRNKPVTWIKMDIEGAELHALKGCAEIIKKYKPRLSICVYHKLEHLYQVPLYIKSLRSDYRMCFRHHSERENETVLYAY